MAVEFLGRGKFASCYKIEDNKVIKIYENLKTTSIIDMRMVGIENDTYVFPIDVKKAYENIIVAIIMEYVNSKNLSDTNWKISDIIESVDKVYFDTDLLSDMKIETKDIHFKNILYNGMIKIIDTDFYTFVDENNNKLKSINIANFNQAFSNGILLGFSDKKIVQQIIFTDELLELVSIMISDSQDNRILKEFLIALKKRLEKEVDYEVNDYQSIKDSIKQITRVK